MRLFCSNAVAGEDFNTMSNRMRLVVDALDANGHNAYCPVFDSHKIELQAKNDTKAIFDYAFDNLRQCDGMVAIVTSDRKSEGQLMEIGAILASKKPLYLFVHESAASVPSHLNKLATQVFIWKNGTDLQESLQKI